MLINGISDETEVLENSWSMHGSAFWASQSGAAEPSGFERPKPVVHAAPLMVTEAGLAHLADP
jgi:hypothetical protein